MSEKAEGPLLYRSVNDRTDICRLAVAERVRVRDSTCENGSVIFWHEA